MEEWEGSSSEHFLIPALVVSFTGLVILSILQKYCGKFKWFVTCAPLLLVLYIILDPYSSMSIAYLWTLSTNASQFKLPQFTRESVEDVSEFLFNSSFWTLDINEAFFDGFFIKIAFVLIAYGLSKCKGKLSFIVVATLVSTTETILIIQYIYQEAKADNLIDCKKSILG